MGSMLWVMAIFGVLLMSEVEGAVDAAFEKCQDQCEEDMSAKAREFVCVDFDPLIHPNTGRQSTDACVWDCQKIRLDKKSNNSSFTMTIE